MRSHTPRDFSGVCSRCFLKDAMCLCAELPRLESLTEIVIVRHTAEQWLTSNTARLATLMLPNARILKYGGGEPFDDALICSDGTWLLFPGRGGAVPSSVPRRLVVLDGTFRQARRMYKRITALHSLPELSLAAPTNQPIDFAIRRERTGFRRSKPLRRHSGSSKIRCFANGCSRLTANSCGERMPRAVGSVNRRKRFTRATRRGWAAVASLQHRVTVPRPVFQLPRRPKKN